MYKDDFPYEDPNDFSSLSSDNLPEYSDSDSETEIEYDKKTPIPRRIKIETWIKWNGYKLHAECGVGCGTIVSIHTFDCGHIRAEKKGGKIEVSNLRPICKKCNSSMGTRNMYDFIVTHGFKELFGYVPTERKVYSCANNVPNAVKRRIWHDIAQEINPETNKPRNSFITSCSVNTCTNSVNFLKTKYAFYETPGEGTIHNVKPVCNTCFSDIGVLTICHYELSREFISGTKRSRKTKNKPRKRQKMN